MNVVAALHSYKFTHFANSDKPKTKNAEHLSLFGKIDALLFGISNPRPVNKKFPAHPFETIRLKSNKEIECWWIKTDNAKGSVIIFHGYSGEKSAMLDKAEEFLKLGYNTLLVDFMGCGGSEGNQTTIGFKEAEEVNTCFEFLKSKGEQKIILFGTSMGAAAIIKSINDYHIEPQGIIIECPFGTMYKTIGSRFRQMGVPAFPMAALLDFWGGVENGFEAFGFSPAAYARSIKNPVLLIQRQSEHNPLTRTSTSDCYIGFYA